MARAASPRRLPALASPIPGEALPAWLHRFAEPLDVPPGMLLFDEADERRLADPVWWRHPATSFLERLAARGGVTAQVLETMTFSDWLESRDLDEVVGRLRAIAYSDWCGGPFRRAATESAPGVWPGMWCPTCARNGRWAGSAFVKRTPPSSGPDARTAARHSFCRRCGTTCVAGSWNQHCRCGARLGEERAVPAQALAVRLQSALRSARKLRAFEWPGLAPMPHSTAVALIDLILGIVWIGAELLRFGWQIVRERELPRGGGHFELGAQGVSAVGPLLEHPARARRSASASWPASRPSSNSHRNSVAVATTAYSMQPASRCASVLRHADVRVPPLGHRGTPVSDEDAQ